MTRLSTILKGGVPKNPLTTRGDLLVFAQDMINVRLPLGLAHQVLSIVGGVVTWIDPPAGILSFTATGTINQGDLVVLNSNGTVSTISAGNTKFIGIAQTSVTNGQSVVLGVKGWLDEGWSTLSVGASYYADPTNVLTTNPAYPLVGIAYTPSSIRVGG